MFNKSYSIKGKHADYMRYLIGSSEGLTLSKSAKIFDYGYQVLFVAPLIGVAYERRQEVIESGGMDFTIQMDQVIKNKSKLERTYRMVLLADKSLRLEPDERVDFVFRPEESQRKEGENLFNSYMRGGIDWLYNEIAKEGKSTDDYLNNIISVIGEFIVEFGVYRDDELEEKIREVEEEYS